MLARSSSSRRRRQSRSAASGAASTPKSLTTGSPPVSAARRASVAVSASDSSSPRSSVSGPSEEGVSGFNRSPRGSLADSAGGDYEPKRTSPRNSMVPEVKRTSPRNSLTPDPGRSPRGSLVPDQTRGLLLPEFNRSQRHSISRSSGSLLDPDTYLRGSRYSLAPDYNRSPRGSLVPDGSNSLLPPDFNRSPRNSLVPESTRGSRHSLVPDTSRSPRGSLVPDDDRSPRNCLAPDSSRGSRNSLIPSDFNRSPRNSLVPEYDRSPRNSIVPDSNRSPRGSLTPADMDRSPRGSLTPEPSLNRTPRGSLTDQRRISPKNSLIPDYDRSPRRSLIPEFERSPRNSLVPTDFNRSPRNSIIPDSTYLRSPRGSIAGDGRGSIGVFGSDYSARNVSVIEPAVAGPSHTPRSPSPYRLSVSARGAQINLGYNGSVYGPGSRRASSSVSQMFRKVRFMGVGGDGGSETAAEKKEKKQKAKAQGLVSADDRRRLCERSKLSGAVGVLRLTAYGSVVYQLKDANMEASGSVDFVIRALRIVYKTVGMTVILTFLTTLPLLMLIMGVQFVRDCPREPRIPIYMIVGGVTGIVRMCWLIYSQIKSRRYERLDLTTPVANLEDGFLTPSAGSRVAAFALNTFLIVWFILGNFWIIHIFWPDFHSTLFEPNQWCSKSLYIFSLVHLGIIYSLIIIFIVGVLVMLVCQLFSCPIFARYK